MLPRRWKPWPGAPCRFRQEHLQEHFSNVSELSTWMNWLNFRGQKSRSLPTLKKSNTNYDFSHKCLFRWNAEVTTLHIQRKKVNFTLQTHFSALHATFKLVRSSLLTMFVKNPHFRIWSNIRMCGPLQAHYECVYMEKHGWKLRLGALRHRNALRKF